jgi:hypothetical protein
MDGSIVKVQCLTGGPSKLQLATLRAATAAAAAASDLRQATAQPPSSSTGAPQAKMSTAAPHAMQQPETSGYGVPPATGTTLRAAQPAPMVVKEEPNAAGAVGAVGSMAPADVNVLKRHTNPGDVGPGMGVAAGFHEAKRVKLEVQ